MQSEELESALRHYESRREEIYRELEIAFVQRNIRCKLQKKEIPGVELLFFDESDDGVEESLESLISESADATVSEASDEENFAEESMGIRPIEPRQEIRGDLCEYLDLEAAYSGEDGDEEEDGEQDLPDIIDNTVGNNINLDPFLKERREQEEKTLRKLKEKFVRKKKTVRAHEMELMDVESNDDFPEIREFYLDQQGGECNEEGFEEGKALAAASMNKKVKVDEGGAFFSDESKAIAKLSKEEEKKNVGFIQRTDDS